MLSSSFSCDQIYKGEIYDLGHTFLLLKCDLDAQQANMLKQHQEQAAGLLKKSSCLAPTLGVTKFITIIAMYLAKLSGAA